MAEIKARQKEILRSIIEDYIETAEPVGSESIVSKSNLGVSPATIRNEMAALTEMGYLNQPHTSAGRAPTPLGMRFYINELMKEAGLAVKDEVEIKEALWESRYQFHRLLKRAASELAAKTGALAVATTEEGDIYYAGAANILDMPEFYDIDLTRTVLSILDRADSLGEIFDRAVGDDPVHILLGDDIGREYLDYCGLVFAQYGAGKKNAGNIGIIGPVRMHFDRVIPTVRYFGDLLTELSATW
ncbi:MAG: hypothetical protein Q8P13_05465 [bacterium]|nr:hypothetical protein [bacterium]